MKITELVRLWMIAAISYFHEICGNLSNSKLENLNVFCALFLIYQDFPDAGTLDILASHLARQAAFV